MEVGIGIIHRQYKDTAAICSPSPLNSALSTMCPSNGKRMSSAVLGTFRKRNACTAKVLCFCIIWGIVFQSAISKLSAPEFPLLPYKNAGFGVFKKKNWRCWVFVALSGLSLVAVRGLLIEIACCRAQNLGCVGSSGISVPGPRIESMTPALADRFLTTRPPRKFQNAGSWFPFTVVIVFF